MMKLKRWIHLCISDGRMLKHYDGLASQQGFSIFKAIFHGCASRAASRLRQPGEEASQRPCDFCLGFQLEAYRLLAAQLATSLRFCIAEKSHETSNLRPAARSPPATPVKSNRLTLRAKVDIAPEIAVMQNRCKKPRF